MLAYLAGRVVAALLMIWSVATVTFILLNVTGDPVAVLVGSGPADPAQVEAVRHRLGLDKPVVAQYFDFLVSIATGHMADSYRYLEPSMDLVLERLPATVSLAGPAVALGFSLAIPAGLVAAIHRNTWLDYAISTTVFLAFAIPTFLLGTMLVAGVSVGLRALPTSGMGDWRHMILPTLTLAMFPLGQLTRIVRSEVLDVLQEDYVRTARAKGIPTTSILLRHVLRNAMLPVVTFTGLIVSQLAAGSVVTETVFAWPGIGRLAVGAALNQDFPLVQATVVFIAVVIAAVNFLVDILYLLIDPRIRRD